MEESLVHEAVTLEAQAEAAKAVEPGEKAFDDPTVAGELPVGAGMMLGDAAMRAFAQGDAMTDAPARQGEAKGVAVITPVGGQTLRASPRPPSSDWDLQLGQDQRRRRDVGHVAAGKMQRQRQAVAVHDYVALGSLAGPCATDLVAPFLAFT